MLFEQQKFQPEPKLSSRKFRYCAISWRYPQDEMGPYDNQQTILWGTIEVDRRPTQNALVQRTLNTLAMRAAMTNLPWNCFNVNLILKAV